MTIADAVDLVERLAARNELIHQTQTSNLLADPRIVSVSDVEVMRAERF